MVDRPVHGDVVAAADEAAHHLLRVERDRRGHVALRDVEPVVLAASGEEHRGDLGVGQDRNGGGLPLELGEAGDDAPDQGVLGNASRLERAARNQRGQLRVRSDVLLGDDHLHDRR